MRESSAVHQSASYKLSPTPVKSSRPIVPESSPLWVEGIKMPDAEKMATEMGFSGAQAKEAAAWNRTVRHLDLQCIVTKAEALQCSGTSQCRFRRWCLSEATLMANLYKDGISCHTGTKQRAAGPHNDLPDQRRSGKS